MNRWTIALRTLLRRLGLTPVLALVLNRLGLFGGSENYEEKFSEEMLLAVEVGDVVWEIGANRGIYTRDFCERVGKGGKVYAFEPTPDCFEDLTKNCKAEIGANCECFQLALGIESGTARMRLAVDPLGATHSVLKGDQNCADSETIDVEMVQGDELVRDRGLAAPTFLKVDVEGSELDVLEGMRDVLKDPRCRAVFCEVHFGLLAERGQPYASKDIEALLDRSGLTSQRWIDPSHIVAMRPKG